MLVAGEMRVVHSSTLPPFFSSKPCKYSEPALVDISILLSAALPLIRKDSGTARLAFNSSKKLQIPLELPFTRIPLGSGGTGLLNKHSVGAAHRELRLHQVPSLLENYGFFDYC